MGHDHGHDHGHVGHEHHHHGAASQRRLLITLVLVGTYMVAEVIGGLWTHSLALLAGISSGANVWGARQAARRMKGNIATVLPDRVERYFSTSLL